MNILFVAECCIEPSTGGVQRVTDTLAKGLIGNGHLVFFLSVRWGQMVPNYKTSAPQFHIDVEHTSEWEDKVLSLVKEYSIEYVINQMPGALTNRVLQVLKERVKSVSVFHTQPYLEDDVKRRRVLRIRANSLKQRAFKIISFISPSIRRVVLAQRESNIIIKTLSVSDKICFISEKFFPRIKRHIPNLPFERIVAINNPNTFDSQEEISKNENLIIWVGRIENDIKNTLDFVKIWNLIYKDNPSWTAIVAGDGRDLDYVKHYAQKRRMNNISFIGRSDDIQNLYRRAKIVVVTSFSESWCMALVEGLSHSCVVCAFDTFETVHDIIHSNNGVVTRPSPKAMALQLSYLMNHPVELNNMSKNACGSIKRFRVEVIVKQWESLLKSL